MVFQEKFDLYKEFINEISDVFNTLVNEAYGEEGLLEFEMNLKQALLITRVEYWLLVKLTMKVLMEEII